MTDNKFGVHMAACLLAATLAGAASLASAQDGKTIVAEHVPAFPAFTQWITTTVPVQTEAPVTRIETVNFTAAPAAGRDYQPFPVIVGMPELPLVGAGAAQAARVWGSAFNFQGVHMRQVVLDPNGRRRELRSMSQPLRNGERFKIRVTATFDAVAEIDQVIGDAWYGKRTGQVYPQQGMSVQLKAGETVDLPLGPNDYFVMNRPANERLIVVVRHPGAVGAARSDQPAYRQDVRGGSSYLQLVPSGTYPGVEQLVAQGR